MKYFRRITWLIVLSNLILLLYVGLTNVDGGFASMRGTIYDFNAGWSITDGDSFRYLANLPYEGESEVDEIIIMENDLPKKYRGMTLSFSSSDVTVVAYIDGTNVYEYGTDLKGKLSSSPGSTTHFIDIPSNPGSNHIRIELSSPYRNKAATMNEVSIGNRDTLILKRLTDNVFNFICSIFLFICGCGFFYLHILRRRTSQETNGIIYLSVFCIAASLFYIVATNTMSVFYANQQMYTAIVFQCMALLPLMLIMYYSNDTFKGMRLRWYILAVALYTNIVMQTGLQFAQSLDFGEMVFISHCLYMAVIVIVTASYIQIRKKLRRRRNLAELLAFGILVLGLIIDTYVVYGRDEGSLGIFGRFCTTLFAMLLLYKHFREMVTGYADDLQENADLLQREVNYMSQKTKQLEEANARAEQSRQEALMANDAKSRFLAHMSHEIRTPINAVLGMNTMVLREAQTPEVKGYAMDIQNAGQSLLALINDILDFSKVESGKMEIIPEEYDFGSLIHDVSTMIEPKIMKKRLEFVIDVDETIPSRLIGDDVRVRQIFVNLLNNAAKYTHEGTVTLKVSYEKDGNDAVLHASVIDTGIGIKKEDLSKLFNEFERIEEKRNHGIEGSGLGLNITKALLRLMDSKLEVESEYGVGSRFYFTLRQQIADATPIGSLKERLSRSQKEYSYEGSFTAPDAHILVVDDNAVNTKVFANLLKETKADIDIANDGPSALQITKDKRYDVIFLDHMMPGMDGIETLHIMKQTEDNKCLQTPVVALTANAVTGAREMYLAEGFDEFLPKPIQPDKLEQMIVQLLPSELLQFSENSADENPFDDTNGSDNASVKNGKDGSIMAEKQQEIELPVINGIDWSFGLLHVPDRAMLLDTVHDFYLAIGYEADKLEDYYRQLEEAVSEDILNLYRIQVHAMKSSANLIGAFVLGGLAKLLEDAAAKQDVSRVLYFTPTFLSEWRGYKRLLIPCVGEDEQEEEKSAMNPAVVQNCLDTLSFAFEQMDVDRMDEVMEILQGFSYSDELKRAIETLGVIVTNLDEDSFADQVVMIRQMIDANNS